MRRNQQKRNYGSSYGYDESNLEEGPIRQAIKEQLAKGYDKIVKLEGTAFWAHQFAQHFEFIQGILNGNKNEVTGVTPELMVRLRGAQNRWNAISEDPHIYKESDYEKTLALKEEVKSIVSNLPCIPDLLVHMIEELNYFQNSVRKEEYNLQDEVSYWATEHAENLDFVNCELPELIKAEGNDRWPRFLYKAFEDNKKLSEKFRKIAYNNQAGFLAGLGKVFGIGLSADNVDSKELDYFMRLKEKHIAGIDNLIAHIPELPLTPKTMKNLFEMLNHERNEAIFAFERIGTYGRS